MTFAEEIRHRLRFNLGRLRPQLLAFCLLLCSTTIVAFDWIPAADSFSWIWGVLTFASVLVLAVMAIQLDSPYRVDAFMHGKPLRRGTRFVSTLLIVALPVSICAAAVFVFATVYGFPGALGVTMAVHVSTLLAVWVLQALLVGAATRDLNGAILLALLTGAVVFWNMTASTPSREISYSIEVSYSSLVVLWLMVCGPMCVVLLLEALWQRLPRWVAMGAAVLSGFGVCAWSAVPGTPVSTPPVLSSTPERLELQAVEWPSGDADTRVALRMRVDGMLSDARYELESSTVTVWFADGDSTATWVIPVDLGGAGMPTTTSSTQSSVSMFSAPDTIRQVAPVSLLPIRTNRSVDSTGVAVSIIQDLQEPEVLRFAGRRVVRAALQGFIVRYRLTPPTAVQLEDGWHTFDGTHRVSVKRSTWRKGNTSGPQWTIRRSLISAGKAPPLPLTDMEKTVLSGHVRGDSAALMRNLAFDDGQPGSGMWLLPGLEVSSSSHIVRARTDSVARLAREQLELGIRTWVLDGRLPRRAEYRAELSGRNGY